MLPSKRLLLWHRAKEAKQRAEEELNRLEEEKRSWEEKLEALQQAMSADAPPPSPQASPDDEIARLLREQELWLARKEWERFLSHYEQREAVLSQEIHQRQFEIWEQEQQLDQLLVQEYQRIAERAEQPVVEVRNQSCMGCFMPLSLSKLSEWRRGKGVVTCDECGRILV
jgi:predicted  nucleic acid-binding Zn-ribbon protein